MTSFLISTSPFDHYQHMCHQTQQLPIGCAPIVDEDFSQFNSLYICNGKKITETEFNANITTKVKYAYRQSKNSVSFNVAATNRDQNSKDITENIIVLNPVKALVWVIAAAAITAFYFYTGENG